MSLDSDILYVPPIVSVEVAVEPVSNMLASLFAFTLVDQLPGFSEWTSESAQSLPDDLNRTNRLLFKVFSSAFEPETSWPTFPAYLEDLAHQDPAAMQNRVLEWLYPRSGGAPSLGTELEDLEIFLRRIGRVYPNEALDQELMVDAYDLLNAPSRLQTVIVTHLSAMWEDVLRPDWEKQENRLRQTAAAYQERDFSGLTAYEAIERITGRDLRGSWQYALSRAQHLTFIPSAHMGPYLVKFAHGSLVRVVFGARPPSSRSRILIELPQTELLIRLRALADETRLRIIALLLEHGEVCAQEVVTLLDLSQSSASRHLSQLSATGFVIESQREGKAKCYSINPDRFKDTLMAIASFTHIDL